jgi:APA family basic amino acid/polyamine antiporter
LAAVLAVTAVNLLGIRATARVTRWLVAFVVLVLATVVAAALLGGEPEPRHLWPPLDRDAFGILQAAGFLFFAFAGYARLATLGEEVIDPARTIPRAIPIALGITLGVYAAVAASVLLVLGPDGVAGSAAPLASAVQAGRFGALVPLVRIGATVASLSVLLSLVVGVSRTAFAMASQRDLPRVFAAVHPRTRVPHRAELAVAVLVAGAVAWTDLRSAIGFSSFCVLTYYAIANACALTLPRAQRRWPRWLAGAGLGGCALLAFSLPAASVLAGAVVLGFGAVVYALTRRVRRD